MVNAAIIPITVVDEYMAAFWRQVIASITAHNAVTLRTGASLAVPIRKGSPKPAAQLNEFPATFGFGSAFGNMMERRYLVSMKSAKQATSAAGRKKLLALAEYFKKYSGQYQLDYLPMAAQGYQQS